ncbi:NADH-Ubiquinone oxidoreductase B12 subunit [Pediculus humanus corporis]|uniref:NADH-Ubiquinone oxidoreductase B12 subunit n=1 Tax=Pediculus humanus subsp. corporis TaxID=121224 RepID=E0VUW2_PEDHC|nr:NADH-Ubiquinone oxidoreductase B12 subunit [Pediculus humanus corporis]EEB17168.1 NADH-Ubiquinone oxidoreductase B12 subunit [Pediculus humanus corporis]
MGGHHHEQKLPPVPDWRIYKVDDVPQLVAVRKALAEFLNNPKQPKSFTYPLFRGFKYGLIAAVITTFAEKAFYNYYYGDDGHSHH